MRRRTRMAARALMAGGLMALLGGCASGGGGAPLNETSVSGDEILPYVNLFVALQDLRPRWLRQAREVFVDGNFAGGLSSLRRIRDQPITLVELVPGREVVRRFGPCQAPGGTGTLDTPRDPQCGTRPVIHVVIYTDADG